jgi:hypothetical protein
MPEAAHHLATQQRCLDRLKSSWPEFQQRRGGRLREQERFPHAAERATEAILEDLFTGVLDWTIADLNHQVGYADIMLSRLGIKYLIVEAKRPGALAWNQTEAAKALDQARRYAAEQRVHCIAISDGVMLYAADVEHGGLTHRLFVPLEAEDAPEALWWLSVHGIYRAPGPGETAALQLLPEAGATDTPTVPSVEAALLHPKHKLPSPCFAFVGDPSDCHTWHLPYLLADGSIDSKRLPKAVQAILSNYRGARLSSVPESAIPDVLVRLGRAAARAGKMPSQIANTAPAYHQLVDALEQLDRLGEVQS